MNQRGRKSTASLAVVTPLPGWRHEPPPNLTEAQAAVWRRVAATKPAEWFSPDTWDLLAQYCRYVVSAERIQAHIDAAEATDLAPSDLAGWYDQRDNLTAKVMALARSMRITQQAQRTPGNAGTESRRGAAAKKPWDL